MGWWWFEVKGLVYILLKVHFQLLLIKVNHLFLAIFHPLSHIHLLSPGLQFPNYPYIQLIFWATQEML